MIVANSQAAIPAHMALADLDRRKQVIEHRPTIGTISPTIIRTVM